ncbi:zinc ribbon domain-containing protein [Streptococcus saliviloxodontae]|uniref:Putative zinc ribbon domain-containing protein n=1 Tax=Streptococcus saliviloxodontae TaxID=1349416 RepID=A0ABS2PNU9_9STRE|nr:zinc ribbon domain-containing protein [Streptococcus saliviloxodontae]MBM7636972.1 hypothetical protein [Streptococcus saliviloxodontae]
MKTICQSCAMPLQGKQGDMRGSEKDGQPSETYCLLCYQGGAFTQPNCSYEAMLARGREGISQGPGNPLQKWLLKATYPILLKKVNRWK